MRTTVNIAEHLIVEAKALAARERTSLGAIVEDSLRRYLELARANLGEDGQSWSLPVTDAGKPVRGVNLDDTSELLES